MQRASLLQHETKRARQVLRALRLAHMCQQRRQPHRQRSSVHAILLAPAHSSSK